MSKQWNERRRAFEVSLDINDDQFLATADPAQRNWVVTRAMEELADDLEHLDGVSGVSSAAPSGSGSPTSGPRARPATTTPS